jgi:hypothetical protein
MRLILTLAALLLVASPAQAQTAITVGLLLDQAEEAANEVLTRADAVINGAITNAAVNTINTVAIARIEYEAILDHTLDRVDETIRSQMLTLQGDVRDLERALIREHDRIDDTITKLSIHLRDIVPLSSKVPRVLEFNSPVVVRSSGESIPITFSGVLLNHPRNKLQINGQEFPPLEHNETRLTFDVPTAAIYSDARPDESTLERAVVTTRYGWFGWRKKTYAFLIRTVPAEIATLDVIYEVQTDTSETRERASQWWGTRLRSGCPLPEQNQRTLHHSFNADVTAGYTIVAARAEQDLMSGGCNSSCSTQVENWGPGAASIRCDVRTDRKSCVNCNYRCRVVVTEKRPVTKARDDTTRVMLSHGEPVALDLPKNTSRVKRIEALLFNGERLIMDEAEREVPFIRADYDPLRQQVLIRPLLDG